MSMSTMQTMQSKQIKTNDLAKNHTTSPFLSILVPVYGVEAYLPVFLASFGEDLPNDIEIIFVNDTSPDNSKAIIQAWQASVSVKTILINNSKNQGLTRNRQILLDHSQGDYVWYLDPDDVLNFTNIHLQDVMKRLKQYRPDVLLCDYDVFFDKTNQTKYHEKLIFSKRQQEEQFIQPTDKNELYRLSILDDKHYFWNKIFRRTVVLDLVSFTIAAFEDIAYTPIWLYHCQSYYYLPISLVRYRIRENSITKQLNTNQVCAVQAYQEQAEFCKSRVKDEKSLAYLRYKSLVYYFRLLKKAKKSSNQAEILAALAKQRQLMETSIISTLKMMIKQGMLARALKIWLLSIRYDGF